jgi:hypothetical protein
MTASNGGIFVISVPITGPNNVLSTYTGNLDGNGVPLYSNVTDIIVSNSISTNTLNANVIVVALPSTFGNLTVNNIVTTTLLANTANVSSNSFTLGTSNNSANGFTYLPNGLLLQWGHATSDSTNIVFPTAFSSNAYVVTATTSASAAQASQVFVGATIVNSSSFQALSSIGTPAGFLWMAIGH